MPEDDVPEGIETGVEDGADIQPVPQSETSSGDGTIQTKLLRLQADFDNFRRRNASARQEARDETRREILGSLLPVYDNFHRAFQHAGDQPETRAFLDGLEGIMLQFEELLKKHGLEEIGASPGTAFDPNLHEATGMVAGDTEQEDTIAQELQKGYVHKGFVIRPAQVMVYSVG